MYNAAAVTSYTLGQSDAKGAFLPRCQFSGDQQTGTLLDGNHVLNVFFNGAFWSRLLTALDAANLFATSPLEKIGVLLTPHTTAVQSIESGLSGLLFLTSDSVRASSAFAPLGLGHISEGSRLGLGDG